MCTKAMRWLFKPWETSSMSTINRMGNLFRCTRYKPLELALKMNTHNDIKIFLLGNVNANIMRIFPHYPMVPPSHQVLMSCSSRRRRVWCGWIFIFQQIFLFFSCLLFGKTPPSWLCAWFMQLKNAAT